MIRHPLSLAAVAVGVVAALAFGASATALRDQGEPLQRSFSGDEVRLELSAGHYRITGSGDQRIRVKPLTEQQRVSTRIETDLTGSRASVQVAGPAHGFDADIALPAGVGLIVRLASGSLRVSGIQGNTSITADAADVQVALGNSARYRKIVARVGSGEYSAPVLGGDTRGSGTLAWTGSGRHEVRVDVRSGRVTLTK